MNEEASSNAATNEAASAANIIAAMQEAVVYADLQGTIVVWNHGAELVFGFSSAEAVGQSVDIIVPEKMRKAHWDGFNKAIAHGDILSERGARMTRALQKNGEPLYVEMSFAMVHDAGGALTGSIAVARDATARFMAERAARQAAATTDKPAG
ncbi:MAG: PAS domain-containing protein [Herminiimonas sp.]|nr:PAS domain-containing protein [Herminiimonas sp.]